MAADEVRSVESKVTGTLPRSYLETRRRKPPRPAASPANRFGPDAQRQNALRRPIELRWTKANPAITGSRAAAAFRGRASFLATSSP
jgi:hypothetical protein